ncbi:MAG: hypothetical protein ACRDOO_29535 [Actinomadura sp.]
MNELGRPATPREFSAVRWFGLDEPAAWAAEEFDPQMYRFVAKLAAALEPADVR